MSTLADRIPDSTRPAIELGRALDATLDDLRGVAVLLRAARAENLIPPEGRVWAERLDTAADRLDAAAEGVAERPRPGERWCGACRRMHPEAELWSDARGRYASTCRAARERVAASDLRRAATIRARPRFP